MNLGAAGEPIHTLLDERYRQIIEQVDTLSSPLAEVRVDGEAALEPKLHLSAREREVLEPNAGEALG